LLALEGRLLSMLYRTSFVSNMFESLFFVKNSFITLNKKVHSYSNQQVNLYTILSFHPIIKNRIYFSLAERLIKNKRSLFNPPKYFFISYWFLFAYMFKAPQQKKLVKT
jgi:Na+-transporting NADH:ubiquinone oxidoreductase subunit NqrE